MSRDLRLFVEDIRSSCRKIMAYTGGLEFSGFATDAKTVDAVVRNLQVIGEAVKQLPPEWRQKHPKIDWRKIAGLRDILVHAYFGVDVEIVWDIAHHKVPELLGELDRRSR